jgi:hypothetical protein
VYGCSFCRPPVFVDVVNRGLEVCLRSTSSCEKISLCHGTKLSHRVGEHSQVCSYGPMSGSAQGDETVGTLPVEEVVVGSI